MKYAVSISVINTFLSLISIPNSLSKASWTWIDVSTSMNPPSSLQCVLNEIGTPWNNIYSYIPSFGVILVETLAYAVDNALGSEARLSYHNILLFRESQSVLGGIGICILGRWLRPESPIESGCSSSWIFIQSLITYNILISNIQIIYLLDGL